MSRVIGALRGNLIAVIALAVALGGLAYAGERDSVGAKEWKVPKVRSGGGFIDAGQDKGFFKKCKKGERYISGGFDATPADEPPPPLSISQAGPRVTNKGRANGFSFIAANTGTTRAPVTIYALCLPK